VRRGRRYLAHADLRPQWRPQLCRVLDPGQQPCRRSRPDGRRPGERGRHSGRRRRRTVDRHLRDAGHIGPDDPRRDGLVGGHRRSHPRRRNRDHSTEVRADVRSARIRTDSHFGRPPAYRLGYRGTRLVLGTARRRWRELRHRHLVYVSYRTSNGPHLVRGRVPSGRARRTARRLAGLAREGT
jgi:hypothetical protein